jgi:hypothetical protein
MKYKDKIQHVLVSAAVVIVCGHLVLKWFGIIWQPIGLIIGTLIVLIGGYWKEKTDPVFDWMDYLANCVGIAIGVFFS